MNTTKTCTYDVIAQYYLGNPYLVYEGYETRAEAEIAAAVLRDYGYSPVIVEVAA